MAWLYIFAACVLEIGWVFSLKGMEGFTKPFPWVFAYVLCGFGAAFFLSLAMKYLPVGSTYAIWVGIAAAGANLIGMFFLGEPCKLSKIAFVCMILAGVIGLKLSANE
jgi:quaternary ammonium compound-resistance protein SugE